MTTLFALFAEVERNLISERTRESLAKARASGRKLGRPKGSLGVSPLNGKEDEIRHFLELGVSKAAIAKVSAWTRTRRVAAAQLKSVLVVLGVLLFPPSGVLAQPATSAEPPDVPADVEEWMRTAWGMEPQVLGVTDTHFLSSLSASERQGAFLFK